MPLFAGCVRAGLLSCSDEPTGTVPHAREVSAFPGQPGLLRSKPSMTESPLPWSTKGMSVLFFFTESCAFGRDSTVSKVKRLTLGAADYTLPRKLSKRVFTQLTVA